VFDVDGTGWVPHMDQRTEPLSGAYDAVADATTWTLPFNVNVAVPLEVVMVTGSSASGGVRLANTTRPSPSQVRVVGNWSSGSGVIGRPYTMRYRLSPIYLRNAEGIPDVTTRVQVRNMALILRDTGYLRAEVTPAGRGTIQRVYNAQRLGRAKVGSSEVENTRISFAVQSRGDSTQIDLVNDSPMPSAIVAMEWTGSYDPRTKRL